MLWREWASFSFRESYKAGLKRKNCCLTSWVTIELISTISQGERDKEHPVLGFREPGHTSLCRDPRKKCTLLES